MQRKKKGKRCSPGDCSKARNGIGIQFPFVSFGKFGTYSVEKNKKEGTGEEFLINCHLAHDKWSHTWESLPGVLGLTKKKRLYLLLYLHGSNILKDRFSIARLILCLGLLDSLVIFHSFVDYGKS